MNGKFIKTIDLVDVPSLAMLSGYLLAIREVLGVVLSVITIVYTIWKFQREYFDKKKVNGTSTKKPGKNK